MLAVAGCDLCYFGFVASYVERLDSLRKGTFLELASVKQRNQLEGVLSDKCL